MKNKDNVRKKNKLSKTQQDFIQLREAEEKEEYKRPATVLHSEDYKMYEHQIKWEIRRKTRMYYKAIEEKKKEKEIMTQAKPCPGSQRIVDYMQRTGNIHNNLYEKGTQQKLNKNRKINVDDEEKKKKSHCLTNYEHFSQKSVKCQWKL